MSTGPITNKGKQLVPTNRPSNGGFFLCTHGPNYELEAVALILNRSAAAGSALRPQTSTPALGAELRQGLLRDAPDTPNQVRPGLDLNTAIRETPQRA